MTRQGGHLLPLHSVSPPPWHTPPPRHGCNLLPRTLPPQPGPGILPAAGAPRSTPQQRRARTTHHPRTPARYTHSHICTHARRCRRRRPRTHGGVLVAIHRVLRNRWTNLTTVARHLRSLPRTPRSEPGTNGDNSSNSSRKAPPRAINHAPHTHAEPYLPRATVRCTVLACHHSTRIRSSRASTTTRPPPAQQRRCSPAGGPARRAAPEDRGGTCRQRRRCGGRPMATLRQLCRGSTL